MTDNKGLPEMKEWVTISWAADFLGVSRAYAHTLARDGHSLPSAVTVRAGGPAPQPPVLVLESEVRALKRSRSREVEAVLPLAASTA